MPWRLFFVKNKTKKIPRAREKNKIFVPWLRNSFCLEKINKKNPMLVVWEKA